MKKNERLSVLECGHCYNQWRVDTEADEFRIISEYRKFDQPRDVELYRSCGVYGAAGIPYEIMEVDGEKYSQDAPYIGLMRHFSDAVSENIRRGSSVLIANGYCAYAPAIVGGIQRAIGADKKIGVVWIDAHSDNRILETTTSKDIRLVGLPISVISGQTFNGWRIDACGMEIPVEGSQILVGDGRMNGAEFDENLKAAGSRKIESEDFDREEIWQAAVKELSDRVDAIYLSVDADILREEYIPAYAKKVPGGHDMETVRKNIVSVMETGKVLAYSIFCVDFDRYEDGGKKTYESGRDLVAAGLEKWEYIPT